MTDVWYRWYEKRQTVHDEFQSVHDEFQLIVPWANPYMYEHPFDFFYATPELAYEGKQELAPDEDWVLVKVTREVL